MGGICSSTMLSPGLMEEAWVPASSACTARQNALIKRVAPRCRCIRSSWRNGATRRTGWRLAYPLGGLIQSARRIAFEALAVSMNSGGERGIRTLEGLLTLTPLAGVRLRPLGHLSGAQAALPLERSPSYLRGANRAKRAPDSRESAGVSCLGLGQFSGLDRCSCLTRLALDPLKNLLALHRDGLRRIDAQPDLVALDTQDSYGDFITDHHGLADSTRKNKHLRDPPWSSRRSNRAPNSP